MSGVWKAKVDRTTCIQPGQEHCDLTYVIIDLYDHNINAEKHILRIKE
jgi:hypothetical protein